MHQPSRLSRIFRLMGIILFGLSATACGWIALMDETVYGNPMPWWAGWLGLAGVVLHIAVYTWHKNRPKPRRTFYLGHGCTLSRRVS